MDSINYIAAWIGILCGVLSGVVIGLFFDRETWLGGYTTWGRRMVRLAHIAFFGIAIINFLYAVSVEMAFPVQGTMLVSKLLIIAAIGMPLVCLLAAWKRPLRYLFPIPALSLVTAVGYFVIQEVLR